MFALIQINEAFYIFLLFYLLNSTDEMYYLLATLRTLFGNVAYQEEQLPCKKTFGGFWFKLLVC